LLYVAIVLCLGAYWALIILQDYPQSDDVHEIKVTKTLQPIAGLSTFALFAVRLYYEGYEPISLGESFFIVFLGWSFVFVYELRQERRHTGIMFGPGVPFVSRERVEKLKRIRKGGAR